jgi:hypothetical protein
MSEIIFKNGSRITTIDGGKVTRSKIRYIDVYTPDEKEINILFARIHRKIKWLKKFDSYSPYERYVDKLESYIKELEYKTILKGENYE